MDIQVLGISGSPVQGSNTDWAVRKILKYTGLETRFIKLSDYDIQPCQACLGCVEDNECIVNDEGRQLARLFGKARAFVLGGYTPFNSLDARTKIFMERMYCLRHQAESNRGKLGVVVLTTALPPGETLPPAVEISLRQIEMWMTEEGLVNLGALILLGNVPYIRSGHGDDCSLSGVRMLRGLNLVAEEGGDGQQDGDATKFDPAARELGERIRQAVTALGSDKQREAV